MLDTAQHLLGNEHTIFSQRFALVGSVDALLDRETEDYLGQRVPYSIPLTCYPTSSGAIIINSPGSGEAKDGRHSRWSTLGQHLQDMELATLVTYNAPRPDGQVQLPWEPYSYKGASWNGLLLESLAHVIEYSLARADELCGTHDPVLR